MWKYLNTYNAGSCPAGIEGNFNDNGTVDAADYTVWQDNGGDQADYLLWKTNFEALPTDSEAAAAVPEPFALLLVLMALTAAPLRVRCG